MFILPILTLGLFGFVFPTFTKCLIFIILFYITIYVHLTFSEFGFVLHNLLVATKALRHKGTKALRHKGTKALRHKGTE